MFNLLIFFSLFLSIFFLSHQINTNFYQFILLLTRNKKISLGVLIVFLLPGTIIHELSHFLIATLLFVPVGSISIFPKVEEGRIKAGSLHHADTDPIRRSLIGLAPMIIGIALIYIFGKIISPDLSFSTLYLILNTKYLILFYLLLTTSLSIFSSKKDLEVAWFFIPLVFLLLAVFYYKGLRISFTLNLSTEINQIFSKLNYYLLITLGLDFVIFTILKISKIFLQKVMKVKIVGKS